MRNDERRWLVLGICCLSIFLVAIDNTIVNVALPDLRRDLDASVSELQWVVSAYTLVLASLLILAGSTADRFGRARIFKLGLLIFSAASLACGLAPNVEALVAFRVVQAIGGSMLNPVAMSIIRTTFTDDRERAQAIGIWGGVVGVSFALGPVLGGALVEASGWRAIFFVNVPIGLVAIALTARYVAESRAERPRRFDPVGQALVIVGLAALTYGIIEAPSAGWTSAQTVGCFALSALALGVLVPYERRRRDPLIDPRFFGSVPLSGATLIAVTALAGFGGFLFLNTIYLQSARGLSPLHAGLLTLPLAAMTAVAGPFSGRLVGRRGPRLPLLLGGAGLCAGGLLLTGITLTTPYADLVLAYAVFGFGFGLLNPPITNTAVSGMPPAQAGVAAAVASTSRQVGQTLGVALAGAIAVPAGAAASGAQITHDSLPGWWLIAACGAAVVVLGLATTTRWAQLTAARTAQTFAEEPEPAPA